MYNKEKLEDFYIKIVLINLEDSDLNYLWTSRIKFFLMTLININFCYSDIGLTDLIKYNKIKKSTMLEEYIYNIPNINKKNIYGIEKPSKISTEQHGYLTAMIKNIDNFVKNVKSLDRNEYIYNNSVNLRIEMIHDDEKNPSLRINNKIFSGYTLNEDLLYYISNYNELKNINSEDLKVMLDINRI